MSETVNQGNNNQTVDDTRTFTQAELDAVVRDRVKREREKYADYEALKEKAGRFDALEEASKTELQKATERATALQTEIEGMKKANEIRDIRERVANDTGVPISLLTATTEEEALEQAKGIIAFARPGYPSVKDGGEARGHGKNTTRQQFAEWFNSISK